MMDELTSLQEAELRALRRLIDRMMPIVRACEAGGVSVEIVVERGDASAHFTISEEVTHEPPRL